MCVDPPLCRGTSQGKYSSCAKSLVCVSVRSLKRLDRQVDSVRCGKE